ncbi:MAG: hypothetical protein J6N77_00755 [Lachnospiraceae bacterium]|nr:hypothetical protein [Lachnospiraceae bacterium]
MFGKRIQRVILGAALLLAVLCLAKPVLAAPPKGAVEKDGKYYFYLEDGTQLKQTQKIGKFTYYIDSHDHLEAYKKGKRMYFPNGKKMKKADREDYETYRLARKWVKKITKKSDSKKEKLYKCFKWVQKKPWVIRHSWSTVGVKKKWQSMYANDHFKGAAKGGDCISDACALAYLARAIGYKNVYVAREAKRSSAHAWTEIDGKIYDAMFAPRDFDKYYGTSPKRSGHHAKDRSRVAVEYE